MLALHDTSAHLAPAIRREGLRVPFEGQGISLVRPAFERFAWAAAATACKAYRRDQGGDWREAKGLIVSLDTAGLEGFEDARNFDGVPIVLACSDVPAFRLRGLREIVLPLGKAAGLLDFTAGMARRAEDGEARVGDIAQLEARGYMRTILR